MSRTETQLRHVAPVVFTALLAVPTQVWAEAREYELKAEYIERFTRFVEWPSTAFADDKSPFVFCVAGQNPFGRFLDELVRDRRVQNRKAMLRSVADASGIDGCHLLFVTRSVRARVGPLLARAAGRALLTVGDSEGLAQAGVLLNLYFEGPHLRFEVNTDAIKRSGLKFSSRLLKLARTVNAERAE